LERNREKKSKLFFFVFSWIDYFNIFSSFPFFSLFLSKTKKRKNNPGKNNFLKTSKNVFLEKGFSKEELFFLFLFWREIERK
jgi:hypothetical protein